MFEQNNYISKEFPVSCVTGVIASSTTGKLIPTDKFGCVINPDDKEYSRVKKKIHAVNKKTLETIYTRVYSARPGCIEMNVLMADHLCRKGLNWHVAYTATLYFDKYNLVEKGYKTLEYWLGRSLDDDLLIPKEGFEEPKGELIGSIVGISNFITYYGIGITIKDIFKAFEAGRFYGKTGLYELNLRKLRFGVEIEFTGMTRRTAAEYIAEYFHSCVTRPSYTSYDRYYVRDNKGRVWSVKSDSSIMNPIDYYKKPADSTYKCELETPILDYDDIELLQDLVRGLRKDRYMEVNSSCGIHVHVDAKCTPSGMKNIYNLIASHQKLLARALKIKSNRLNRYCCNLSGDAYSGIPNSNLNMTLIEDRWDDVEDSRYRFVNFQSFFNNKGIEFRCFNSTTHAGKVKAYIQLCLAICNYAASVENVRPKEKENGRDLTRMRNWLHIIGLTGDEFKTCRYHLTRYLKNEKVTTKRSNNAA